MPLKQPPQIGANPLENLRGIVLPEQAASWWPLAPGWWGLIVLSLLLIQLSFWLIKKYKLKKQRVPLQNNVQGLLAEALKESQACQHKTEGLQHYLKTSNQVFKRIIKQTHHDSALILTGEAWVKYLSDFNKTLKNNNGNNKDFSLHYGDQLYSRRCDADINLIELNQWAEELSLDMIKRKKPKHKK